jgi:hypothetical protein
MPTVDSRSRLRSISGLPVALVLSLAALGVLVTAAVVPAVFTIDDNNYLVNVVALRGGHVTVSNTAGLTPSRELLFFDPGPKSRQVDATPVASVAPPLYALIALPFSYLGWRGLVTLNTLAYLVTIGLVYAYCRRYSQEPSTPWIAACAFALGAFAVEYSLGVWPHALSVALCTAAIVLAGRSIDGGRARLAGAAGLLLGVAAGLRYQNAVLIAAVGAAVFLLATRRRFRLSIAFITLAVLPLMASATINHARLGSWNPISKGKNYLRVPIVEGTHGSLADPLLMFWAQVVDYSVRPPLTDPSASGWMTYEPATGAHLMMNAIVKKAMVQSAPWFPVGFVMCAMAWLPAVNGSADRRRQLRLLSFAIAAVLAVFSFAGIARHDGLAFNARYLLELLPLAAVAFAWALDGLSLSWRPLLNGAIAGALAALAVLLALPLTGDALDPFWLGRQFSILKAPLALSLLLLACWVAFRSGLTRSRWVVAAAAGACLGWAMAVHVAEDVPAANALRRHHLGRAQALARVLPDRSALFAYWGQKIAPGALLLDRDVIVVDPWVDDGADAPVLVRELLAAGRRVFVIRTQMPEDVLERVLAGLVVEPVASPSELEIVELRSLGS